MSYSFDVAQRALTQLQQAANLDNRQREILTLLALFIDELHEESHKSQDKLNRGQVAEAARNIDIALQAHDEGKEFAEKWRELNQP